MRLPALLLALAALAAPLAAQDAGGGAAAGTEPLADPLAGVFDSAGPDAVAPAAGGADLAAGLEKRDALKLSGAWSVLFAGIAGWTAFPDWADPAAGFLASAGFDPEATFSLDARPDKSFRAYGTLKVGLRPDLAPFPQVALGELFCDFYPADSVYIRVGKQAMAWGQGMLFSPADLMAGAADDASVRVAFPTLLEGASLVALAPPEIATATVVSAFDLASFGGRVDFAAGPVLLGAGVLYRGLDGLKAALSAKATVGGVDVYAEAVGRFGMGFQRYRALAGGYWLAPDSSMLVQGEWSWDGETSGGLDHSVALRIGFNNIFGTSADLGLEWRHAFLDGSGQLLIGLVLKPWDKLTIDVGVPVVYGAPASRYPSLSEDPGKRALAIAVKATFAGSF